MSGEYSPTRGSKQLTRRRKELQESLPDRPTRDIAAEATEAARKIDALAAKCGNVKGGFVAEFRRNALFLELATDAILTRGHAAGQLQEGEENERLRERNKALEEEVALLRKEKERGKQTPPPPPPPPPAPPRPTGEKEERGRREEGGVDGDWAMSGVEELPPLTLDEPPACLPSTSRMDAEDYADFLSVDSRVHAAPPVPPKPADPPAKKGGKRGGKKGAGAKPTESAAVVASPSTLNREEVRAMIVEEVGRAMSVLQRQLEDLMGGVRRLASLPSGNGARNSTPKDVPLKKGTSAGCPVPETGGEKGAKKRKGKGKGGKAGGGDLPPQRNPKTPVPPSGGKQTSGKGVKPSQGGSAPGGKKKGEPTPSSSRGEESTWARVVGRKERRRAAHAANPPPARPPRKEAKKPLPPKAPLQGKQGEPKGKKGPARRRVPKTSAVVLTCPNGDYARTMAEVRASLPLSEVGIRNGLRTRTAATGAVILEVSDPTHAAKADALAARMREVLATERESGWTGPVKRRR